MKEDGMKTVIVIGLAVFIITGLVLMNVKNRKKK